MMNWNSLNDDSDVKVQSRQPAQISTTFMSPKSNPGEKLHLESHKTWSLVNIVLASCMCQFMVLFCSIPALFFSIRVAANQREGNLVAAFHNSKNSLILNLVASILLIAGIIVSICVFFSVYAEIYAQLQAYLLTRGIELGDIN